MKKGFYIVTYEGGDKRGYFLTGEKEGNKWIDMSLDNPNPEWWSLNWMCLPKDDELKDAQYSETNPTDYNF